MSGIFDNNLIFDSNAMFDPGVGVPTKGNVVIAYLHSIEPINADIPSTEPISAEVAP